MEDWKGYILKEVERKLRHRGVQFKAADTLSVHEKLQLCDYRHDMRLSKEVMGSSADSIATYTRYHIDYLVRLIEVSMAKDGRLTIGLEVDAKEDEHGDKIVRCFWTQMGYSRAIELYEQVQAQRQKHKEQAQQGHLKDMWRELPLLFHDEIVAEQRRKENTPHLWAAVTKNNNKRVVCRVLKFAHCSPPCKPNCPGHCTIEYSGL